MSGCNIASEHALDVIPRFRLVSPVMQRDSHHPVSDQLIDRVDLVCREAAEPLSKWQRAPVVAHAKTASPQRPKSAQLIFQISEVFC